MIRYNIYILTDIYLLPKHDIPHCTWKRCKVSRFSLKGIWEDFGQLYTCCFEFFVSPAPAQVYPSSLMHFLSSLKGCMYY